MRALARYLDELGVRTVLAPRHRLRKAIVPNRERTHAHSLTTEKTPEVPTTRTPWAQLLRHAFDALKCQRCGATMQVVALVRNRDEARRYLEGTGQYSSLPATRWKPP